MYSLHLTRLKEPRLHILFWLAYALYYFAVNRLAENNIKLLEAYISTPVFALICYTFYRVLRLWVVQKRYLYSVLTLVTTYTAYAFLMYLVAYVIEPWLGIQAFADDVPFSLRLFLQTVLVILGNFSWFGAAYFFMERSIEKAIEQRDTAEEKLRVMEALLVTEREKQRFEYVSLAGTVPSHLLVNVINSWAVRVGQILPQLAVQMQKTYFFMRFYMEAHLLSEKSLVTLRQEVEQIETVMDLDQANKQAPAYIHFDKPQHLAGYGVPATSLITLLTNALKHGVKNDPSHPIRMVLRTNRNGFEFTCTNTIATHTPYASHGVGLANLHRRLELIYGNAFRLEYGTCGSVFTASLKIEDGGRA